MTFFKRSTLFVLLAASIVLFTSALPSSKVIDPKKVNEAVVATKSASVDGKLSYTELKRIAKDLKGEKLTLKEKISLKVFGKKISSKATAPAEGEGKSQVIALILVALLGGLGIHRFYLGYTWQGVVQLLTLGGCGVWALIDLVRIIMGTLKPKDGEYGKTL